MNSKTFNKIIKLNKSFYKKNSVEFSKSRQNAWVGWGRVVETIKKRFNDKKKITVLDIGCGNGRFLSYIREELGGWNISYAGLDINKSFLKEAEVLYGKNKKVEFKHFDIINNISDINAHYDVVVGFGITHHIPSSEFRKTWFYCMQNLLNNNALLCLTFWQIQNDTRFEKSVKSIKIPNFVIAGSELDDGDYFLGWADKKATYRYVHVYRKQEIGSVISTLSNCGIKVISDFYRDGKTRALNRYLLFANNT